jgi:hypothetical protein
MMTVPLHGKKAAGRVALVDDEDYEIVMQYRWYVLEQIRNGRTHGPYAIAHTGHGRKNQRTILMHKLLTGWPQTDHRNHDGLDNQRSNLRPATDPQNHANERKTLTRYGKPTSSRFKGVYWATQSRRWAARIRVGNGKRLHLGSFRSEIDAARAYDEAALAAWGEYACLNFPPAA